MRQPFGSAILIGTMVLAGVVPWNAAVAQNAATGLLEQNLKTQYPPGTVLVIQQGGIVGVNPECPGSLQATYKDGQLHAPGVVQRVAAAELQCSYRGFPVGWKVNI